MVKIAMKQNCVYARLNSSLEVEDCLAFHVVNFSRLKIILEHINGSRAWTELQDYHLTEIES